MTWFASYVTERSQYVAIDGQICDSLAIQRGVPQGSILGPVLFLVYVNDFVLHLSNSTVGIFADDTTLAASTHYTDISTITNNVRS